MTSRTRGSKKKKRQDDEDSDMEDDEEDERVLFFIPSAGIDIEVLVFYLKKFLGHDSDAEPGRHPKNRDIDGYFIRSRLGLSAVMVEDLKRDSITWRKEKSQKRTRTGISYSQSDTARDRVEKGASGKPNLLSKRGDSVQPPQGQGPTQPINTQTTGDRNRGPQETFMRSGSYPSPYSPADVTSQRVPTQYQAQQSAFPYASPPMGQPRPNQPISFSVNLNTATYAQTGSGRHQSPPQGNVLPSIEDRFSNQTPAPPYEEGESKHGGGQPSSTGTHGFSTYSTAGPRNDRHSQR